MTTTGKTPPPIVYSCSGCSNAAQMANTVAIWLDRAGTAEMSCIAGVGGDVRSLVRVAQSGRPIVGLDGCRLHCVRNCPQRHGVDLSIHVTLSDLGVRKRYHQDPDPAEARTVFEHVSARLREELGEVEEVSEETA
jgi:uncharacterized metal-binding protein